MAAYLDLAGFKAETTMPVEHVDELVATSPGWIDRQLERVSRLIDSRLAKRYAVPFGSPAPDAVKGWLADIVALRCYLRRGVDPADLQMAEVKADHDRALAELLEAANAETGLFDLPLLASTTASGISRGGPQGYSEQSPYVWTDQQSDVGRAEDRARRGSGG
jgi:hypothetical protein